MALTVLTQDELKKRHTVRGTKPAEQEPTTLEGTMKDKGSAALKAENGKLKKALADLTEENVALKAQIKKLEK